jgi:hypothetical protein
MSDEHINCIGTGCRAASLVEQVELYKGVAEFHAQAHSEIAARLSSAEFVIDTVRRWLKEGATIRATDPAGQVLEMVDGNHYGGLTVVYGQEPAP